MLHRIVSNVLCMGYVIKHTETGLTSITFECGACSPRVGCESHKSGGGRSHVFLFRNELNLHRLTFNVFVAPSPCVFHVLHCLWAVPWCLSFFPLYFVCVCVCVCVYCAINPHMCSHKACLTIIGITWLAADKCIITCTGTTSSPHRHIPSRL